MRALVMRQPASPMVLETLPDPVPGPGEAVARVFTCGAGLTVQHIRAGRSPATFPRILGHEIAGEIVAIGPGVDDVAIGDEVTAYFYLTCGKCKWCINGRESLCANFGGFVGRHCDGGYAEMIKLPARNFLKLPPGLSAREQGPEIGVITDALATPYKVLRRARIGPTDTVAVFGAGGGLGVHMLLMAKFARANVIAVDINADKLARCRQLGASQTVDASTQDVAKTLREMTGGRGVDVAVDFVSTRATQEAAVAALGTGGRLAILGGSAQPFTLPANEVMAKELEILGSRYVTRQEVHEALAIAARGDVWPVVSEVVPFEEAEALHARIERGEIFGRAALRIA
ncbi:MAG: alcohol dehydrogenase catalytic domain-containing protein [Xanthobacteraceae bacterium]